MLPLPPTSCCTPETGPCTSPEQHSKGDPDGPGMGVLTLNAWKLENWPHLLLIGVTSQGVGEAVLENSPRWWRQGGLAGWLTLQLTQAQNQGYELVHPNNIHLIWSIICRRYYFNFIVSNEIYCFFSLCCYLDIWVGELCNSSCWSSTLSLFGRCFVPWFLLPFLSFRSV